MTGSLVVLTGPMAVCKSATVRALQDQLPDLWLRWQVDDAQPKRRGAIADYLRPEEFASAEQRMFRANLAAIRAYLDQGWSLIAEIVVFNHHVHMFHSAFTGLSVHLAVLTATYDTILQRVQAQDRPHSHLSSYKAYMTHLPVWADVVVATDNLSPEQVATCIRESLFL